MHTPAENICLSVIIPVYNMECYLDKLFDSIRPVDSDTVEWIFVDDGSADRSISMLESFQKEHNNVSVCKQNHLGACAARNLGLSQARGEYIYFFDSDDYFTTNIFSKILDVIHSDHPDLLIGNAYVVNEAYQVTGEKFTGLKDSVSTTPDELFLIDSNPGNKIFRRDIIEKHEIVFDDVAIHQDLNFYLKYIPFCQNIRYISDYMYYYLVRSDSIAHHVSGKIVEVIASMEGVYRFYQKNGLGERYQKELEYNYVKHLCFQIDKLPQMKSVTEQIRVASEFIRVLKTMDYRHNDLINQERIALADRLLAKERIYIEEDYDAIFAENQEKYESVEKRLTLYNQVLMDWLSGMIDHCSVSDRLNNRGIHSIAIYGMGSLGMLLYRDLIHSDIKIAYFVDQQAEESLFGSEQTRIIKSTEIREQEIVDAIIITPVHAYEGISRNLEEMDLGIPVISLLKLVED